jgi:uncharacterized membrane protein YjgN (DUF898 family)
MNDPAFRDLAASPTAVRPVFASDGDQFIAMCFRGGLLQLVTIGFYRFWFLTNVRRRLWSSTSVAGDAFEYLGTGRELLIGFLFALAILAPFFLAYFLVGLEAEGYRAFASAPLYLVLYLFGQYATYRARRYRLTRTSWRGLRFWMAGSAASYVGRSALWIILTLATLGLANPWRVAALERYKMRNTRFGDIEGDFVGRPWILFGRGIAIWLVGTGAAATTGWLLWLSIQDMAKIDNPGLVTAEFAAHFAGSFAPLLIIALLWPVYQAIEWRWFLEGLRLGGVACKSDFGKGRILKLWLAYFGVSLGAAIATGILAIGLSSMFAPMAEMLDFSKSVAGGAGAVLIYLALLLVLGVFYRFFLQHNLWRAVVQSIVVENVGLLAAAQARGAASSALGEGLLDGLEMGGF